MVIDTSVILAIFFKEQHAEWAAAQMNAHAPELRVILHPYYFFRSGVLR